ncbi:unnamed protein product [Choristocarpus tenellus]
MRRGLVESIARLTDTRYLLEACLAFQDGLPFNQFTSGDVAAANGHLQLLRLKAAAHLEGDVEHGSGTVALAFTTCAVDWAATQGHLDVVKWLLETRKEGCTKSAFDWACWNGHGKTVAWLYNHLGKCGSFRAINYAASNGRLELVQWLHSKGFRCTVGAMDGAAGGGHLDVVRWLDKHRKEGCSSAAFAMAAGNGHLHVIEWLHKRSKLVCTPEGLDCAAEGAHLHVLRWMQEHYRKVQCSTNAYGLAACKGHLGVLKWLRETMPSLACPPWAGESAAEEGHLEVVIWLDMTRLCTSSLVSIDGPARKGLMDVIEWLHQNGAKASESAVDWAAAGGFVNVVKFLLDNREEGCSDKALKSAAANGHLECVKLLHERCPDKGCTLTARAMAEENGHLDIISFLEDSDPGLTEVLEAAVASWDIRDGENLNNEQGSSNLRSNSNAEESPENCLGGGVVELPESNSGLGSEVKEVSPVLLGTAGCADCPEGSSSTDMPLNLGQGTRVSLNASVEKKSILGVGGGDGPSLAQEVLVGDFTRCGESFNCSEGQGGRTPNAAGSPVLNQPEAGSTVGREARSKPSLKNRCDTNTMAIAPIDLLPRQTGHGVNSEGNGLSEGSRVDSCHQSCAWSYLYTCKLGNTVCGKDVHCITCPLAATVAAASVVVLIIVLVL